MRRRADVIETSASNIAVAGTKAMVDTLIDATRVDTSEALSNWQVQLGQPVSSAIPPHRPGKKGSTAAASAAVVISEAATVLEAKKPGQPIHLSNLAGHIKYLDEGTAHIPPAGFVPRALLAFRLAADEARRKIFE